jgi:hypothetical protein
VERWSSVKFEPCSLGSGGWDKGQARGEINLLATTAEDMVG